MSGTVAHLERVVGHPGSTPRRAGPEADVHPMRVLTEAMAADPASWDEAQRREVAAFFDGLAPEWHTRAGPGRDLPVLDAFARGVPEGLAGPAAEVGSGIGLASATVASRFAPALAVEISPEMLRLAPTGPAHRVLADGARLPVADGSLAAVVLMNAFLFGPECARVLRSGGVVVWVNSRGSETPIHLPAEAVVEALPGHWEATASEADTATWCVAVRP
ncbi:MAG TPA: class I SAM-dependent methyltransferase [Acidimicrobiales bacterium]|nr:class I SAM-dependent methyltransferase [Acidimicrobiales bacterium]